MSRMRQAISGAAQGAATFPAPGAIEKVFCFGADFLGFAGHFPDFSILPAVVQVLTAVMVAEELKGRPLAFASLENAKFLLQIGPEMEVTVACRSREGVGAPSVDVRIQVPEGLAASFRLVFDVSQEIR